MSAERWEHCVRIVVRDLAADSARDAKPLRLQVLRTDEAAGIITFKQGDCFEKAQEERRQIPLRWMTEASLPLLASSMADASSLLRMVAAPSACVVCI